MTVLPVNKAPVIALQAAIEDAFAQTFGNDTVEYRRYEPAARFDQAIAQANERHPWGLTARVQEHRAHSLALLKQVVASLEERLSEVGVPVLGRLTEMPDEVCRKVFVVHGQDSAAREAVARFLERTGFEPIVLHEQPNQGRTIIEKFEEHSAVSFASCC